MADKRSIDDDRQSPASTKSQASREKIRVLPPEGPARIAPSLGQLAKVNPHVWLLMAMLVVGGVLHYADPFPLFDDESPFLLTQHGMDRTLMTIPVIYAALVLGAKGGFMTLVIVTLLMLPRAIASSSSPPDSLLEVSSIVLVSSLVIIWFKGQQAEKERRLEVLKRLELARQELAWQIEIITKDERRLGTINEICGVVAQSLDLPDILQRILDKVVEEMAVEMAMIFLIDETGRKLELVAHKGVSQELVKALAALKLGEGFNGRVAQSGHYMVVENILEDPRLTVPEVRDEGIQANLIVPLRSKGRTIGTLCTGVRTDHHFSTDDIELMAAIGSQVGIAIENARLYQDALISEESYRDLFENATVAIFVQDQKGIITAANKACTSLMGYPPALLLGMNIGVLFGSQDMNTLLKIQQKLLEGESINEPYDVRLLRSNGSESIVSMTTRLVSEDNRPSGFQHIAIDITERRRMQEVLNHYVKQILTAQEEERKRIARELHDETAQSMLLLLQRMDGLTRNSNKVISQRAKKEIEELREVALQILTDLRRLTHDLRPQILDDLGLVAAVEWLAEDMEKQDGVRTAVEVIGPQKHVSQEKQLLLFRIAQEALSNVRRHSCASNAKIVLEFGEEKARLTVEDNGQGFELQDGLSQLAGTGKLGILGMSERARLAGGTISIQSKPSKGTKVVAEFDT